MSRQTTVDLVRQFRAGRLSRRAFAAGALALGVSTSAIDRVLARQRGPEMVASQPQVPYPLTEETVTLRVLAPANAQVEDFETNTFTTWYEEKTNVHVAWEIVPAQEAQTSLNVRLASGDLPDVILGFNSTRVTPALQMLYGAQGVFLAMNDLIEQHGVYFKEMVKDYPLTTQAITAADGNIYALPQLNDCYQCSMSQKLWIYQPWLDALGLAMPQTTEEFAAVLNAFKEQDANGNGAADDEIPLMSCNPEFGWQTAFDLFFMNAFIYNPGKEEKQWLILRENQVTAVFAQEEWREGTTYLASLFADGLIAPESFTQDTTQLRQVANNPDSPILGSVPAGAPSTFMDIDSIEGGRWTDYGTVPPLEGPGGVRYAAFDPYSPFGGGEFIITSACQNPEVAFRWADGMYELETTMRSVQGVPGENWRWAEEGEIGIDGRPAIWKRLTSFGQVQNYCWRQTGPSYRSLDLRHGEAIPPEEFDNNLPAVLYRETKENYEPYQQPADWTLPPLFFSEEQAQQVAEMGTAINDYVEQTFAAAITGQFDIEAQWEEYLATLEGMGLPQYLAIYQDALNARSQGA